MHKEEAARRGRMLAPSGLDTGFLVGAHHIFSRTQRRAPPAPFVEIQNAAGLEGKVRIAGEDPTPVAPGAKRVLTEPAPERGAADLRDQPVGDHVPLQLGERPAGQRHPTAGGQLTREGFDLDDNAGGESGLAARLAAARQGRVIARGRTVCAIC